MNEKVDLLNRCRARRLSSRSLSEAIKTRLQQRLHEIYDLSGTSCVNSCGQQGPNVIVRESDPLPMVLNIDDANTGRLPVPEHLVEVHDTGLPLTVSNVMSTGG